MVKKKKKSQLSFIPLTCWNFPLPPFKNLVDITLGNKGFPKEKDPCLKPFMNIHFLEFCRLVKAEGPWVLPSNMGTQD